MIGGTGAILRWTYRISAAVAIFTGFGNMPLFGRYYVADIPGLGWSGDFMLNVQVHYIAGAVLLAVGGYAVAAYGSRRATGLRLTVSGTLRALFLFLALLSGGVMAVKNLPLVAVDFPLLPVLNFFHLFMAVLFILFSAGCLIFRRRWTKTCRTGYIL